MQYGFHKSSWQNEPQYSFLKFGRDAPKLMEKDVVDEIITLQTLYHGCNSYNKRKDSVWINLGGKIMKRGRWGMFPT